MAIEVKQGAEIRGGEIVSRMLAAEGVKKVFGIIDGTYFGFYSTLRPNGIDLIGPRHETSAAHMAGAYARLTGQLGVCMASNGPGVANVLPGVAVENAEGNRVLLITSSRREGIIDPDRGGTYQHFPQVEVTRPMTKWSCAVPSVERVAEVMRRAFRISWQGRPGVVHVDIPESIMNGEYPVDPAWFREPGRYRLHEPLTPAPSAVAEAARLLREAELPILHAGSGVIHAGAYAELEEVASLLSAPITTSWAARGAVVETHELSVPMIYLGVVNQVRNAADLVLALGSRIGETDWWGKPPYWRRADQQRLIQVDIDPEVLGNIRPADLPVQADIKLFLRQLAATLREQPLDLTARRAKVAEIRKEIAAQREKLDKHLSDMATPMNPAHVASICQEAFPKDAILVVDGGNAAVWANFFHQVRSPNTVLATFKFGMLGAGVAQTLGAQVAFPDRPVYCIIGDGAMGFHPQEIETAVRNKLHVIYLVMCDRQWGMVKMNQQFMLKPLKTLLFKSLGPDETINADLGEIEFDKLARSMGAHGERVADPAQLKGAIARSRAAGKCAVIHIDVDPVKHMWAPGLRDFKDMHQEPKG